MPVGCDAFRQLADPPGHNAVLKLTRNRRAEQGEHTLHAYHRGFKRFVAYFRSAENRTVAQAFAQSVYSSYGREVARSALEQNHFYRFDILGKPLHTRRVRAIFAAVEKKREEIRQHNRSWTNLVTRTARDGTPTGLVLKRVHNLARARNEGRQSLAEPVDPNRICALVEQALERAGANGTHKITGKELNHILDAIIERELDDREAAGSLNARTQVSGREGSCESRSWEPTPDRPSFGESIDSPLDLEWDAGAAPDHDQTGVGSIEPEPHAATGNPAEAQGGGSSAMGPSVEPFLAALFQAVSNDLEILANTLSTKQISEAVGRIDFAIANTIFDAQQTRPQIPDNVCQAPREDREYRDALRTRRRAPETGYVTPPAGKYYRETLEKCWQFLVERCGPNIGAHVARSINSYDRAGMESVYKSAQDDLELLAGPVEGPKALQALVRIETLIMKAAGVARIPEFAREATHRAYWQYLLERCGEQQAGAIASRVASPESDLRAMAEDANRLRYVLPITREARRAPAAPGSKSDGKPVYGFNEEMATKTWSNFMNGLVGAAHSTLGEARFPRFADRAPGQLRNAEVDVLRDLGVPVADGNPLLGQRMAERTPSPPAEDARDHSGSSVASTGSPLPERPPEWATSRRDLEVRWKRRQYALQRELSALQRQGAGSSSSGSADVQEIRPRQLLDEYMQQAIDQLQAGINPQASLLESSDKLQETQSTHGDNALKWANDLREMRLEYLLFELHLVKSAEPA